MRFLDINAMIGPWSFGELAHSCADSLVAEMRRLGIERSVVFHSQAWRHNPAVGNGILADEIAAHGQLIGAAVLTPQIGIEFGGAEALAAAMRAGRMAAIRLYPLDHTYLLEPWNMEELMEFALSFQLPVLLDMRQSESDLGGQYDRIYRLAQAYPGVPLVLLTVGYRHMRVLIKLMEKCENIHIDTSTFITFRGIEEIVRLLGDGRILFGTRLPFIEAGVSVGRVLYADLSDASKRAIAHGNAERLLAAGKILESGVLLS